MHHGGKHEKLCVCKHECRQPKLSFDLILYALKLLLNFCGFCDPGAIHEYFNPRIIGRRCCRTVKMDIKQTCALCPIVSLLPLQRLWVQIRPTLYCLSIVHIVILVWRVQRCRFIPNLWSSSAVCPSWKQWLLLLWQAPDKSQEV